MSTDTLSVPRTAEHAIERIASAKPDPNVRVTRSIEIGQAIHQGDVYLHRVRDDHPRGKAWGSRQVAIGTQVGSRHIVEGNNVAVFAGEKLPPGVGEPDFVRRGDTLGPVVVVGEGGCVLAHPEHAHHQLPEGTYQTTYQADFSTQQRVVD